MSVGIKSVMTASPKSMRGKPLFYGLIGGGLVFLIVLLVGWGVTGEQRRQEASATQQQLTEEKAKVLEAAALDQLDAGNAGLAVKMLTEVIAMSPRRSESYYYRAVAYSSQGQFDEAIADYDVAVNANPHWALPLAGRGAAHAALGNYDQAIEDYSKAINLEPGEAALYANRGQIYHQRGKLDLARDDFDMAVELAPDLVAARFNRGVLLYALGKPEEALADFNHAIEIDPNNAPPYFNRGSILAEMGEVEAARADLQRFISLSDNADWTQLAIETLASLDKHDE